jgi:spermidine synthase
VRIAILSGILFLSGISALIFETLWLRLSGLVFGNSVWSAALILSSFMAGLALGNAIAASLKLPQRFSGLRFYAALEIAVAVFGCTIVFALPHLGAWLRPLFQALWNHDAILNALRLVISFAILLVPTTAMGLTLPVVLAEPGLRRHEFGRAIGFCYGWNTLGAVVGALLGEVFLVQAFGLLGTSLTAGFLNCVAAAIALLLVRADAPIGKIDIDEVALVRLQMDYARPWRLLFVSFASGALLLCLEVVWFRFLRLYIASSATAFSVMLAVVLAGIGLGGILSGAIYRRVARANQLLPLLFLLAAITTLLSYVWFPGPALQKNAEAFYLDRWSEIALLGLALMFPAAFVSGIVFPAVAARVQESVQDRMNSTGITTLFNTTGAAIGPLLASFLFLPRFGFQWTLLSCAIAYALVALSATERSVWSFKRPLNLAIFSLWAGLFLVLVTFPYHRDEEHFANARRLFEQDGEKLVKKIEGTADTWQLLRADLFGEPYYYRLLTNAFSMSATAPMSQRYMRLFAYLPLSMRPESQDALLICYGLGVTADALVRDARLHKIDIVDISKEVFELADFRAERDYANPLRDPRVKTFVQDARFFLQASPRQYDVITGEPPPPKVIGAVNLYTEEFFALMNSRLNDGGIATFWLPIYQLKVDEAKAILRAFHNAFPNASVWASSDEEWIMLGIKGPGRRLEEVRQLWDQDATRTDLARIGIEVPEQLESLFLMDSAELDRATANIKPLTDFFPKRLTDKPADVEAIHQFASSYMEASSAVRRFRSSPLIKSIWPETLTMSVEPFFIIRETRYRARVQKANPFAELDFYLRGSRLRTPVLETLGSNEFRVSIAKRATDKAQTTLPEALPDLVADALSRRDIADAIQLLETKRVNGRANRDDSLLLTYLYCLNGNVEKAEALAAAAATSIPKDRFVNWLWGKLQAEFGFRPPR